MFVNGPRSKGKSDFLSMQDSRLNNPSQEYMYLWKTTQVGKCVSC